MNAREQLQIMVRTTRGSMTVWSPPEVRAALDAYRAEVLTEAADDLVAACPDHGDADEAWMDCPCEYADELRRMAAIALVEKDTPMGESTPQAASIENYPGELAMLRGILGVIRATATHGGDMGEVRRLLAEHASDEQAAYADAAQQGGVL
ncbi:hypothetical protein ACF07T_32975 [Streptomyces sp. NPDC015184]|uniref:hypothetical protein n=1 Tax=Streptomyces sp. NPDC015184 TaxID=3364946 RepID=UPI0036FC4A25